MNIDNHKQIAGEIWTTDEPYRNLEEFCDVIGSRWAGSASERAGGAFLKAKLESYGLQNVRLEPVPFGAWTRGHQSLELTAPVAQAFSCIALPYSKPGEIEAELLDVGNGEQEDFERLGEAVRGKVVIAAAETNEAGTRSKKLAHRTDKLRFAVDAGAAGMIFVNQNPGLLQITGGIAAPGGGPADIIAVGTSWEHGQTILRLAKRGGGAARVKLSVGGTFEPGNVSYNVVGEIPGATYPNELVLAGAHYDGHDVSQAALDDGAGTIVALEAARVLAALPAGAIDRTIRFVLFCGEEVGLFGSWAYTADHVDEADRTRFMLNLDGAGRGKGGTESLTISGRPELVAVFRGPGERHQLRAEGHRRAELALGPLPVRDPGDPDGDALQPGRFGHAGRARLGPHRSRHLRQGDPARPADGGDGDGPAPAGGGE